MTCSTAQTRLAPVPSATLRLAMRLTTVSSALSWRIEDKDKGKSKGTALCGVSQNFTNSPGWAGLILCEVRE